MDKPLLRARDLSISTGDSTLLHPLSFELKPAETLALVGESGSGKSLTSLAIMGLLPKSLSHSGQLHFEDLDLLQLEADEHRLLRGSKMAMVFQEPMSALNPAMRCGDQVAEAVLRKHPQLKDPKARVLELLRQVKLPRPEQMYKAYPHQLSGGQKQRVVIAIALAAEPSLLIADEPTTALDVQVQSDILRLLADLKEELRMSMLFISHDLSVVEDIADKLVVLYKGKLQEYGPTAELMRNPQSAYTKGLLSCRPTASTYYHRLPLVKDFLRGKGLQNAREWTAEERIAQSKQRTNGQALLEVRKLSKFFGKNNDIQALTEVDFNIFPGEKLGLVGESGSGKTTLGRLLCGLERPSGGEILYEGKDIGKASVQEWRRLHRDIQIVFQDPFSSLNPKMRIGEVLQEVLKLKGHGKSSKGQAIELLEKVGLDESAFKRYPHEFSGGQRQRIGIARALAVSPKFIVCDESVSALDVSVQAQILNLLNDLQEEFQLTYLFISHDLAVVKYFCDRLLVLQNGQLVESGIAEEVYAQPKEKYTQSLIEAMPD